MQDRLAKKKRELWGQPLGHGARQTGETHPWNTGEMRIAVIYKTQG